MRERLKERPSDEIVEYIFGPCIKSDLEKSFYPLLEINYAHLVMLKQQDIITAEITVAILQVLNEMEEKGPSILNIDRNSEDLYSNMEAYIVKKIGADEGGRLHTARSRNDLFGTVTRMNSRSSVLKTCSQINDLRMHILELSNKHIRLIMPGYTCMQPAEPITLGYYLAAHLHALDRDFARLENCYERLNQSPLGSGAMAATTFDIDRELTAELLGFSGPTDNALDGIASRDYVLEILSALSIFMIHLSRLGHDLYIWSTQEFSLIEVNGSVAMCSSIMPQKKNPVTFEHIKSKAAHIQGAYISASSCLKNTPYTQCRDSSMESTKYFWDAFFEVEASISLLMATLKTIRINGKLALERTFLDFSTVTELSNTLVKEAGLSNSLAHSIVANAVTHIIDEGQNPANIDSKLLTEISLKITGRDIRLSDEKIQLALDPVLNVNSKNVTGGPCPSEVSLQLKKIEKKIKDDVKKILNHDNRLRECKTNLHNRIDSLLKNYS